MKKRNGFTLVELLAVIVILAIIMIIAIPSVLSTVTTARQKTFIEFVTKVYMTTEKQYVNEQLINSKPMNCVIYDIKKDLGISSTGDYKGYALVTTDKGERKIYLTIYDKEYMLYGVEYTDEISEKDLVAFTSEDDVVLSKANLAAIGKCDTYTNISDNSTGDASESGSSSTPPETYSFKVGSYIKYYPTSTSYMPDTSKTGSNINGAMNQQPLNPSELTLWRILSINSDGTMDIISEYVSTNILYLYGKNGFINNVGIVNEATKAYMDNTYAKSSRGIGYVNQTEYITNLSKVESQSAPWKYNDYNTNEKLGGGDSYKSNVSSKDTNLIEKTIGLKATTISGEPRGYWISSRHYYCWDSGAYWFHPRYVSEDGLVLALGIWGNSGYGLSPGGDNKSYSIRPIIVLKPGIKEASGKGTKEEPFEITF